VSGCLGRAVRAKKWSSTEHSSHREYRKQCVSERVDIDAAGIERDVLCYDYYHLMACPEWEAAIFNPNGIDQFRPRWSEVDLHGFELPRWFA
jgi:hypothetical protein